MATAMQNANERRIAEKSIPFSLAIQSDSYQKMINRALKDPVEAKRFISSITSAVAVNPQLQDCAPDTILSGALLGNSLGLSPSPQLGQYYLVPFNDKKRDCKVATFQLGYKGYVQLALRSGYYKRLNVMSLKPGELKRYDPFMEEIDIELMPDEMAREAAHSVGYVAMFEYLNGFKKVMYWSREKMEAHARRYSQAYRSGKPDSFWVKDFDAMAYKTMLRQLISKWGIMSIELQNAFQEDFVTAEESADYLSTEAPTLAPVTSSGNLEPLPESAAVAAEAVQEAPQAPEAKKGTAQKRGGRQKAPQPAEQAAPVQAPPAAYQPDQYGGSAEDLPFDMGFDDL